MRLDDEWYASVQTFDNDDAQRTFINGIDDEWYLDVTFDLAGAEWLALDFVPGTRLILGDTVVTLPSDVAVTGFGLYTPTVATYQRFDNFRIWQIPEPASCLLFGLGSLLVLPLIRRRRR